MGSGVSEFWVKKKLKEEVGKVENYIDTSWNILEIMMERFESVERSGTLWLVMDVQKPLRKMS